TARVPSVPPFRHFAMTTHPHRHPRPRFPLWLLSCLLASIAAFLLWTGQHGTREFGVLPYLLLLAVPLLHIGLHRAYLHRSPGAGAPQRRQDDGRKPGASP